MKPRIAGAVAVAIALAMSSCRPPQPEIPQPPKDRHLPLNYMGKNGMVVAAHPLAAEAGLDMLKNGGCAVDAAIATAFALNACEPFASGIGGGGFMLIYMAESKKSAVINFREKAPAAATPTMFSEKGKARDEWRTRRGTAVGVPGMLAGWDYALRKYGTRTLAETARRAIEIAEQGFPVGATFSVINKDEYEKILKNAGETTCYLNDGVPYEPGDTFRNPDLAATLRSIASGGVDVFYKGLLASKIVAAVRDKGGIMTLDDLASYRPVETAPLEGDYKDYHILTAPPPATGGLHVIQLLHVAEDWPLKAWGQNSAAYIHHLGEAMRFIFADKDRYDGDPDYVRMPLAELLSRDYGARIRTKIAPDKPAGFYPFSRFGKADSIEYQGAGDWRQDNQGNTTHICVVDSKGNIVALTQSINDFFGTGIVPEGTGFLLNDHMADFSIDPESPNAPGPGHRPVSNMGPLIALKNGEPFLSLGSPGGTRIFPSLGQIILNIAEFGLPLDEAIEAPRFFTYSTGGVARPVAVEPRIPRATLETLKKMGNEITLKEPYDKYFGGAQGIMILQHKKGFIGGADSRRDGVGLGY
jgi:gamma-glutamyltranspeptidase/glutathione hydrolase